MFKINDYIMYNSKCICIVDGICENEFEGSMESYYVLQPINEKNSIIKIPVDSTKVAMRRIISHEEAEKLLKKIPSVDFFWIEDRNIRAQEYKKALRSGDCHEWAKLTKTLYHKKQEKTSCGKKLSSADENIFTSAENLLHGELALSLGIPVQEVSDYIAEQLSLSAASNQ